MRSRFPLWLALMLLVPVVVMGLGVWFLVVVVQRSSEYAKVARTLPAELAAARQEGLPLTPADLRPNPPVPDSQNAAPIYVQIDQKFRSLPKAEESEDKNVMEFITKPKSPNDLDAAKRILARRAPDLVLVERASRLAHSDFKRHMEQGPNLTLPEYASCRQLARLLSARALLASREGRPIAALNDIATGARMGRHLDEEPILISMLVAVAVRAIMDKTFLEIVIAHGNEPGVLDAAARTAREFRPTPDIERAFRGEVIMCQVCVDMLRNGSDLGELEQLFGRKPLSGAGPPRRQACDAWQARMMSYWRRNFVAMRRHRGDTIATYRALKQIGDEEEANDKKPTYELSALLMPVFSQAELKVAICEEQARLRDTLIDVVSYRKRTGSYPMSLANLGRAVAPDIFTGKPPIYRKAAKGFILYSVGQDFKDDGGKAKGPDGKGMPDIVVQDPIR